MPKKPSKITYVTLFADESIHPKYEAALKRLSKELGKHYPMYIGDRAISSEEEFEHRSPIDTSIVVGHFQVGRSTHAVEAIEAAKRSFLGWSRASWRVRVKAMMKAANLMDERKFDIAVAITYEVGKNRLEALAEVWEAMDAIRVYARIMEKNQGYVKEMGPGGPGEKCRMIAKPLGVWPIISPFNFPFMLANSMTLGALITGNTVILKPTSEAPLTGLMLYKVFRDAGVPPGAVNYITGSGSAFEKEFTSNPDVAGIAFTGSRSVGMRLHHEFLAKQPYAKPVVMELGSKNPVIVTSKADLKKAVEGTVRAAFGFSGQKCSAASRVYVQAEVRDEFLRELKNRVNHVVLGDPRLEETFMGPVVNRSAVKTFEQAVRESKRDGGEILVGGGVAKGRGMGRGFYLEPTIVTGLARNHRLFREELFVPFVVVADFHTLGEALREANETEYGLTAGIFTEDKREVKRFMDTIEFGVVYANRSGGATTGAWPGAQTFVGWKGSGVTGKGIGGPNYLLTFLREQSQTIVS